MTGIKLMPHQKAALTQTEGLNHVAYYLDMGLGKTFVGSQKMMDLGARINLVICQKSKVNDWCDHFSLYADTYWNQNVVYDLTKKGPFEAFMNVAADSDDPRRLIGVINYELAFRRPDLLKLRKFTMILDESSLICNEHAKRSRFVLKMKPSNVILLSGTPTAGKYEKLWSQCQLLGWNISKDTFWASYICTEWHDYGGICHQVVTGYKQVDHLKRKLREHGAVFLKTEEVMDLPEQVEQKIFVDTTSVYRKFKKTGCVWIDTRTGKKVDPDIEHFFSDHPKDIKELTADSQLTKILYARQLCGQWCPDKLQALKDLAESTEDRLVIFYNFTAELEAMQALLEPLARSFSMVNGKTKDLQAYEDCSSSITFIQYQAGAMGLNLQKANKVVYFTLPLGKGSCDLWTQSKKRVHRIGQTRTCFYYYLLCRDSIEVRNLQALAEGRDLTDNLFIDPV